MNIRRITARTAIAGATTALAAGALVGISTTAANAVDVTNTYNCSNAGLGLSFLSEMTVSGDLPVPQYGAGAPVPAGIINITAKAYVPDDVAPLLAGAGVTGAKSKDYAAHVGTTAAGIPLSGDFATDEGGTYWDAAGANSAFVTPAPGTYDALLPDAFTLTAMQGDTESIEMDCVLADGQVPQSFGSIEIVKQSSNISVPKTVTVKKGKAAKLTATFSNGTGGVGIGKVVAKKGSKTLDTATVKNGMAKLNLGKKLPVGKNKITVTYVGNPSINTSSAKTTVIVKK
ncbi:MAG: hypothetical protein JWN91_587 [Nocardioides sp.]|jgi:hypothetical protein|nr:hypothetical protein [Nocardioides sp.]